MTQPIAVMPKDIDIGDICHVDLWIFYHPQYFSNPMVVDEFEKALSEEERSLYQSIAHESTRMERLATRALVRMALSSNVHRPLMDWKFVRGRNGRPEVASPRIEELYFNASNTADVVACATSRNNARIGIDIESIKPGGNHGAVARRCFAAHEQAAIRRAGPHLAEEFFLRFWTLKEAYLKACGEGLSHRLGLLAFSLPDFPGDDITDIALRLDMEQDGKSSGWRFRQWRLASDHILSLAVDTRGKPLQVIVHDVQPNSENAFFTLIA